MEEKVYKIILADDHEILLDSLEGMLHTKSDLKVISKVGSGDALVRQVDLILPDLCIVDMDMPVMNGMVASEKLLAKYPELKIMILSMHAEKSLIKRLIQIGIKAYLTKTCDADEFLFAVYQVLKGKTHFSSDLLKSSVTEPSAGIEENNLVKISQLSPREKEIVKLICDGLTNNQIADKLFLSAKTIDNHRSNVMKKLEVHNIVELIRFCLNHGLAD